MKYPKGIVAFIKDVCVIQNSTFGIGLLPLSKDINSVTYTTPTYYDDWVKNHIDMGYSIYAVKNSEGHIHVVGDVVDIPLYGHKTAQLSIFDFFIDGKNELLAKIKEGWVYSAIFGVDIIMKHREVKLFSDAQILDAQISGVRDISGRILVIDRKKLGI